MKLLQFQFALSASKDHFLSYSSQSLTDILPHTASWLTITQEETNHFLFFYVPFLWKQMQSYVLSA